MKYEAGIMELQAAPRGRFQVDCPIIPWYRAGAIAQSHWATQPVGTRVGLTLADGSTQEIVLADYYYEWFSRAAAHEVTCAFAPDM
jgi:hypothetical protein